MCIRDSRQTSALDGDKLLDNQDMCELLGITKRTLARYRQKKLVTYYMTVSYTHLLYFRIVAHGGFLKEALVYELHGLTVSDDNYLRSLNSGRHVEPVSYTHLVLQLFQRLNILRKN